MTNVGFIVVIGTAAVGFMLYVLVAICKDHPSEKCHVVHILHPVGEREAWDRPRADSGVSRHGSMADRVTLTNLNARRSRYFSSI